IRTPTRRSTLFPYTTLFRSRDFTGAGGLFSVVFDERYSAEQVDRFVESLELFAIGWSWGGACSLAMPYDVASMRPDWAHRGTLRSEEHTSELQSRRDLVCRL